MADNASVPLPRDGSSGSMLAWANAVVNFLRRNVILVTERISTVVTEYVQPITEDRDATLDAAEAFAAAVQAEIIAANNYAQEIYDQYEAAAQANQASLAQFYLTQAANRVEQKVRIDEDEVLSQSIQTVQSSLGATNAAITNEITARVNGDNALASQISTVQSQANGNSATITTHTSSINGIHAQKTTAVNLNGHVVGLVQIDGTPAGSNFIVVADRMIVSHPSAAGTLITPFIIGLVNNVSTVGINGQLVVDGTILARHLVANAVTAAKISAGAVTADKIAAAAITSTKIAAGAITADKMNVTSLSAVTANAGTITAGLLRSNDSKMIIDLNNKIMRITT